MVKRLFLIPLILTFCAGLPATAQELFDPAPGTYRHDILLTLTPPQAGESANYRIEVAGTPPANGAMVPYQAPLYLSALPGEKRSYRVTVQLRKGGEVSGTDQSVFTIDRTSPTAAPEARAPVPPVDLPGGSPPGGPPGSIPVLSPISGSFANRQLLYVDDSGFAWVRYTLDGSDPSRQGTSYDGPVMIERNGKVDLRVAALVKGASTPLTTHVQFSVDQSSSPPIGQASGVYTQALKIEPPKSGAYYYTFQKRPPGLEDIPFEHPLVVSTAPGSIAYNALEIRAREPDGSWGGDFRYFFAIDRRSAPPPVIEPSTSSYLNGSSVVRVLDAYYTKVYYTIDGSTPDKSTTLYQAPFTPNLPPRSDGTLTIKARAYAPNGSASEIVTARIPYSTRTPAPPRVRLTPGGPQAGGPDAHIAVEAPQGSTVLYERTLDGTVPHDPTSTSPRAPTEMTLSAPRGAAIDFTLKFAVLDRAGNISPSSSPVQTRVNAYPPAPPTIEFANGTVTLSGQGTIRFTMSDTGAPPEYPGPKAQAYSTPISLPGRPGERLEYYLAAVSTSAGGERSAVARGGPYVVDLRSPPVPSYWGVEAGGIYNGDRTLSVEPRPGVEVHYTLSADGTPPAEPDASSPIITRPMQFSVPAGSEKFFVLKLRSSIGGRLGPVATVPFTIDRIAPRVPVVDGLSKSGLTDHPVTIEPPHMPLGDTLYIATAEGEGSVPGDPLGAEGRPFQAPVRFSAPAGEERLFHVRLAARDAAGNTTEDPTDYLLTIDRRVPPAPSVSASPPGSVVEGGVTLTLQGTAHAIHYELTDDGGEPALPTAGSPLYREPLSLSPRDGRPTLYTLYAVGQSAAGLLSRSPTVYRVLLLPAGGSQASKTPAGQGSAAQAATGLASKGLITGVEEGALYDSARTLRAATPAGELLRYTLDPNGGDPPPVGRFSQLFPKELLVEPSPGDTRHYAIRVAAFANAGATLPSAQELLRFTIDRTPPAPPTISGIADNARYQKPQTFTLEANGTKIYYSIEKLASLTPAASSGSSKYVGYTGPVTIGGGEAWAVYRIRAYSVDMAGNRSVRSPEWTVYFDSGVVYASPAGSDANDGSSAAPVKTLDHALQLAQAQGRGAVFLATGNYLLTEPLHVTTGIGIVGDFDPRQWRRSASSQATTVTVPADSSASGALFTIDGGALSIDRIVLHDERRAGSLAHLERGSLSLSSGSATSPGGAGALIEATGGHLALDHESLEDRGGGPVVSLRKARADVTSSSFAGTETTGVSVLMRLADSSNATITDTRFHPAAARRTISIESTDSELQIDGSQVEAGTATGQSTGLYAANSKVSVTGSHFVGSAPSHISFGIQAQGSTLEISESTFQVAGGTGAAGIWADSSHLTLERSRVDGSSTAEFLYLVKLTDSEGKISGDILTGGATGDYLGISLTRSQGAIVGNTLFGGSGTGQAAAIAIQDSPDVDIVDNIIARNAPAAGKAISIRSGDSLPRILANDLFGYKELLDRPQGAAIERIAALNAADGVPKGGPISGNLSEAPDTTFLDLTGFELSSASACIGVGVDPAPFGGSKSDYRGAARTSPYDIGAVRHR